ncbi:MAG: DUF2520 domain-containing protein [Acidobacteria bacterium]|nr:DUF2520 domain-containing protein [Acidobacteriota bacterium]
MAFAANRRNRPSIALAGAGSLATALGPALVGAGYRVMNVVVRDRPASLRKGRFLARRLGAQLCVLGESVTAELLWICVRDDGIASVADALAASGSTANYAFHSSGALLSEALSPLRAAGVRVASVHPLMTFAGSSRRDFRDVWFGVEGDDAAVRLARQIIGDLKARMLRINPDRKALYHAWAVFASPLLVAELAAGEEIARSAGLRARAAREAILPLVDQTIANYRRHGAASAFTGPLQRGDVATVARHLEALRSMPDAQGLYVALARIALRRLPVKQRAKLSRLLGV